MKAKKYTQKDKFHLVYYTSVEQPNHRHKQIAKKLNREPTGITQKIGKMRATGEYDEILNAIMQEGWVPKGVRKSVPKREEVQLELPLDEPKVQCEPAKIYWSEMDSEPEPDKFTTYAITGVLLVGAMALAGVIGAAIGVLLI